MHKILLCSRFIKCLYLFRAVCGYHQEVKIVLYSISESSLNLCTGRPPTFVMIPDAVKYNFDLLMMST